MKKDNPKKSPSTHDLKQWQESQWSRSRALGLFLGFLSLLFYGITMVKFDG